MADRKRVFAYTRVSTAMQVDGKSLEGQLAEIKKYCASYNMDIVHVYSDEGKSGKSIAGREEFQKMLSDLEDNPVDYVVVWKLSRFGRNACDSLNALKKLQRYGTELIAVEECLRSDSSMGMFMLTIFSAMAEMERENILAQTQNGKKYNALDGNWNGGQPPYGYDLIDKKLVVNEKEAAVVRKIFSWYMEGGDETGYATVTARLNEEGIVPRQTLRLDRKAMLEAGTDEKIYLPVVEDWYTTIVKKILDCPVYCGKIRFGYYKVTGVDEDGKVRREYVDNPIMADGNHEAIITEELWNAVQEKRRRTKKIRGRSDSTKESVVNVFNRIARCPQCGGSMVSYASRYTTVKGKERTYYQYICGYWNNHKKGKCSKNPIRAEFLDGTVIDAITEYVHRPNITEEIAQYMEKEMDTTKLEKEIADIKKELKELDKAEEAQYTILSQIGLGKFRNMKPEKISENIDKICVQRKELEDRLVKKEGQVEAIRLDKLDFEMIKSLLVKFNEAYAVAPKELKKKLVQSLIKEVKLGYDERGKVIPVSMTINFTGEQIGLMAAHREIFELNESSAETVVLLSKGEIDSKKVRVEFSLEDMDMSGFQQGATYEQIKAYVLEKHGLKVSSLYISQVKRKCGLDVGQNYNLSKKEDAKVPQCPPEKEAAIMEALKHFHMV